MVPMTFIWWIYHFWARFWPYFNFVDFRAYFGPFPLVNRDRQKMADLQRKMASNQKMQENKPTLKFNFTIEKRWPVSKFSFWHSHWALCRASLNSLKEKVTTTSFQHLIDWFQPRSLGWCATCVPGAHPGQAGYCDPALADVDVRAALLDVNLH